MDKPPVKVSKSGVSSVSPADILRSQAGQAEIRKTLKSNMYTGQTKGTSGATAGQRSKR